MVQASNHSSWHTEAEALWIPRQFGLIYQDLFKEKTETEGEWCLGRPEMLEIFQLLYINMKNWTGYPLRSYCLSLFPLLSPSLPLSESHLHFFLCSLSLPFSLCLVSAVLPPTSTRLTYNFLSHKWEHMPFVFLCLICFTQHTVLQFHLCWCK